MVKVLGLERVSLGSGGEEAEELGVAFGGGGGPGGVDVDGVAGPVGGVGGGGSLGGSGGGVVGEDVGVLGGVVDAVEEAVVGLGVANAGVVGPGDGGGLCGGGHGCCDGVGRGEVATGDKDLGEVDGETVDEVARNGVVVDLVEEAGALAIGAVEVAVASLVNVSNGVDEGGGEGELCSVEHLSLGLGVGVIFGERTPVIIAMAGKTHNVADLAYPVDLHGCTSFSHSCKF